jgi:hypothetical protein
MGVVIRSETLAERNALYSEYPTTSRGKETNGNLSVLNV